MILVQIEPASACAATSKWTSASDNPINIPYNIRLVEHRMNDPGLPKPYGTRLALVFVWHCFLDDVPLVAWGKMSNIRIELIITPRNASRMR